MCSLAVQPIMKAQGKGVIVNIASGAGVNPGKGQAAYGAAKAGVINMSKSMAFEWAPEIRVNSIAWAASKRRTDRCGRRQPNRW